MSLGTLDCLNFKLSDFYTPIEVAAVLYDASMPLTQNQWLSVPLILKTIPLM